jgi:hypothetical protein
MGGTVIGSAVTRLTGYGYGGAGAWSPNVGGWFGGPGIVIIERIAG